MWLTLFRLELGGFITKNAVDLWEGKLVGFSEDLDWGREVARRVVIGGEDEGISQMVFAE